MASLNRGLRGVIRREGVIGKKRGERETILIPCSLMKRLTTTEESSRGRLFVSSNLHTILALE